MQRQAWRLQQLHLRARGPGDPGPLPQRVRPRSPRVRGGVPAGRVPGRGGCGGAAQPHRGEARDGGRGRQRVPLPPLLPLHDGGGDRQTRQAGHQGEL